jgi:hypothetical protein
MRELPLLKFQIMAKKSIIIYLPGGREVKYSTVDLGDSTINQVKFIEEVRSNVPQVVITDLDGDQTIYKGIPYALDVWDKSATKKPL